MDINDIEKLREKLNKTANPNNLSEPEILALSEELDAEIINYYKEPKRPNHKIHANIVFSSSGTDGQNIKK